jgi:hypothetical protein
MSDTETNFAARRFIDGSLPIPRTDARRQAPEVLPAVCFSTQQPTEWLGVSLGACRRCLSPPVLSFPLMLGSHVRRQVNLDDGINRLSPAALLTARLFLTLLG